MTPRPSLAWAALCCWFVFGSTALAQPEPIEVHVRIALDQGRHSATTRGWQPEASEQVLAAFSRLLDCPVEVRGREFRCRERLAPGGLQLAGKLDLSGLAALLQPGHPIHLRVTLPASPATTVDAPLGRVSDAGWMSMRRMTFVATFDPARHSRIGYRGGFGSWWPWLAAIVPVPLLLWWAERRLPAARWPWTIAASVWIAGMVAAGSFLVDGFYWYVPSVEGSLLRWVAELPLLVLLYGQFLWLLGRNLDWKSAAPFALLFLIRPRSSEWMSLGEGLLAAAVTIGLLVVVTVPILPRGRNLARLPEALSARVVERLRQLAPRGTGGFDLRLDRPPKRDEDGGARFGALVRIPEPWIARLGEVELDSAILLAAARTRYAPTAVALLGVVAIWIALELAAHQLPWMPVLAPPLALAWYTWRERQWDRRVIAELLNLGEPRPALERALAAVEPEWGTAALRLRRVLAAVPRQ